MNYDLFGNPIEEQEVLRERYIEPPFTILDSKKGEWQGRKNKWRKLGILGEVGRKARKEGQHEEAIRFTSKSYNKSKGEDVQTSYMSIFDPTLCEVIYKWFCPDGGKILDPFAGGSVRGIVANMLGYKYTGIDIRSEQIESNYEQGNEIVPENKPNWICGDSNIELDRITDEFDFVFSCPPYANLEVYSDIEGDISNMDYDSFKKAYRSIINKTCSKLKSGCLAVFVVGEVRDKNGYYIGFVPDTIQAFIDSGMKFYNEAILATPVASASMRANGNMKTRKLVKTHQNVLCFKKP